MFLKKSKTTILQTHFSELINISSLIKKIAYAFFDNSLDSPYFKATNLRSPLLSIT